MNFLFDLLPLILFFGAYKWAGANEEAAHGLVTQYLSGFISGGVVAPAQAPIMLATLVGILATFMQVAYLLLRKRPVPGMLWLSLFIFVVFGGAGIYFHDDSFIKWKPTLIYWLFGLALLISHVFFNKNLMRKTMEAQIKLPDLVWQKLLMAWIVFFAVVGVINLVVAYLVYPHNLDAWVNFKVYGITALFFVFIIGQSFLLGKYMEEEAA